MQARLLRAALTLGVTLGVFFLVAYGSADYNVHYDSTGAEKCAICGKPAHWYYSSSSLSSATYTYLPDKPGDEERQANAARKRLKESQDAAARNDARHPQGYYCDNHKGYISHPNYSIGAVVALLVGLVVALNAFYFHGPNSVRYKNPAYR